MKASDQKCIEWINNNHNQGYKILYREYYNTLVSFTMNYTTSIETAEDIVQETFIKLWRSEHHFETLNALKTYLYTSVRNALLDHLQHVKVKNKYLNHLINNNEINEYDTDRKIIEEEVFRKIYQIIQILPERCKEIFELHLQGKNNQEIADLLNLSVLTVKTQKNRAIKKIRKQAGELFFLVFIHYFFF